MFTNRQSIEIKSRFVRYLDVCRRKSVNKIGLLARANGQRPPLQSLSSCKKPALFCSVDKKWSPYSYEIYWQPGSKNFLNFNRFSTAANNVLLQSKKDMVEASGHQQEGKLTVGQKVKQAGKDASYMGIVLAGFAVTGVLIWYVMSELLFSFSPNSVYTKAFGVVKQNTSVLHAIGEPIKAYGEETSRGRRRHVSHQEYIVDGVNYMRVKFYISGSKRKGTVHVDTKETSRGKFEFRYIFVELDGHPPETIIVEDRR